LAHHRLVMRPQIDERNLHGSGGLSHAQYASRIASDDRARGNVFRHNAACAHSSAFANLNSAKDGRARPNRCAALDERRNTLPILVGLRRAVLVGRLRETIVDKSHVVTDEDLIFEGHTFANERMARDLAAVPDSRPFLDFDERANLY